MRVGLLQGPLKDGGKSVLPLSWLRLHGGELPGARSKQKLLECGEQEHAARSCTRKPQCYICAARVDKPRDDHMKLSRGPA